MSGTKEKVLNITRLFNHGPSPFRTCQWPFGEPGTKEFRFCGEETLEGYSYCPKHVEMAYREPEPRKKSGVIAPVWHSKISVGIPK